MIGYLKGRLLVIEQGKWIIEVGGVGYRVVVPGRVLHKKEAGEEIEVRIFTYVKEEVLALYGFETGAELELFEKLLMVRGIGPKMAMNVFNAGSAAEIIEAIRKANIDFFMAVPGIGKKGAQRLIMELKSKLGGDGEIDLKDYPEKEDAVRGLMSLGYNKQEAVTALKMVDSKLTAEEQIKKALRHG